MHGEETSLPVPIKSTVKKKTKKKFVFFLFEIVHCSGEGQKRLKGATQQPSGCFFQAVVHDPAAHLPPNRPKAAGGGRAEGARRALACERGSAGDGRLGRDCAAILVPSSPLMSW